MIRERKGEPELQCAFPETDPLPLPDRYVLKCPMKHFERSQHRRQGISYILQSTLVMDCKSSSIHVWIISILPCVDIIKALLVKTLICKITATF